MWITDTPIAHRGLHNGTRIPENSLAAFEAAAAAGYAIELDVRLLADGVVAVFHDSDLLRLTGQGGVVETFSSARLAHLRLYDTDQRIPLLREVLELVGQRVPLLVETKVAGSIGALEPGTLKALVESKCQYAVQSFSPQSMEWFATNAPQAVRGQLDSEIGAPPGTDPRRDARLEQMLAISRPHFVAYDIRCLPSPHVERHRRRLNIPLLAWTIRTPGQLADARRLADNIIFESIRP